MAVYKIPIEVAIIVFPFVAFILTIPFLIYEYRKYGAIPIFKSVVFYSFILYMITAYFMVVLPLPARETVEKLTTSWMQLKPFYFLEVIKNAIISMEINVINTDTIMQILGHHSVYTVIFNVFLTIPFGIYLRYFFKKSFIETLCYSLLLSIFYEVTQLSALFGIYPRPYRLFDVDDLIINTFGGVVGFVITPIFQLFLPTRDELDKMSYKKGKHVTILRRFMASLIDLFFIAILSIVLKILGYNTFINENSTLIAIILYFIISPIIGSNQTIGKKILNINVISTKKTNTFKEKIHIISRYLFSSLFIIYPYILLDLLNKYHFNETFINIFKYITFINILINIVYYFIKHKDKQFLYEKFTRTRTVSVIKDELEEENDG